MTVAGSTQYRTFIDGLARSESGRLLQRELGRRWPETADRLAAVARYALLPAGKMLRPILTLHAAEAVGGSPADVLAAALGMEYLHVATLVHDDIIDADALRRGRPAVQVAYGVPTRYEITIFRATITREGTVSGYTVESLCDEVLAYGGLTLTSCPRADLKPPPKPFHL